MPRADRLSDRVTQVLLNKGAGKGVDVWGIGVRTHTFLSDSKLIFDIEGCVTLLMWW